MKIVIIDYKSGNIQSLIHALQEIGCDFLLSSKKEDILNADRVILPGVGAFGRCIEQFKNFKLDLVIKEYVASGKYVLGICVGMQILFEESNEFKRNEGLGIIKGQVKKLPVSAKNGERIKIPHTNWSPIYSPQKKKWINTPFSNIVENEYVYFVHSYHAIPSNKDEVIALTSIGGHDICAAIQKENVFGCQFHPEKSGNVGLSILRNFIALK